MDGSGYGVSPFIIPLPTQLWAKVTHKVMLQLISLSAQVMSCRNH